MPAGTETNDSVNHIQTDTIELELLQLCVLMLYETLLPTSGSQSHYLQHIWMWRIQQDKINKGLLDISGLFGSIWAFYIHIWKVLEVCLWLFELLVLLLLTVDWHRCSSFPPQWTDTWNIRAELPAEIPDAGDIWCWSTSMQGWAVFFKLCCPTLKNSKQQQNTEPACDSRLRVVIEVVLLLSGCVREPGFSRFHAIWVRGPSGKQESSFSQMVSQMCCAVCCEPKIP